ncbi:IPT/TIG domain-containing protein [Actinoplanes palleronii]|uniref:IPT/TIG domain-containing protein n=1 Tax=Actinoplanes palleronii TaxID=113570 RepID=A0ABQ4B903_9ACTN|nr:IPT/TIG domain-containing protein [Actinoplanes palleronii]GIE67112.1 hypothetical protein Apa02nite_032200 [Actinoplanes palleronii]
MSRILRRTRTRLVRAGLTTGVVGAALLVAPQAAFAAPSIGPAVVAPGGNASLMDPQVTFAASPAVQLVPASAATCPVKFSAISAAGPWNATNASRPNANMVGFTVPAVNGPTAGTNGAVRPYLACVYEGTNVGVSSLQGGTSFFLGTPVSATPSSGPGGGGGQVTVSAATPLFTGLSAVSAMFTTGACTTYPTANTPQNMVGTVSKLTAAGLSLTVPSGVVAAGASPAQYSICLYDASTSAAAGALLSVGQYTATLVSVTPSGGSYLNSVGITASSGSAFLSGVTAPAVLLVANGGCPGTWSTTAINGTPPVVVAGAGVRRLSNTRAAVTVPPLPISNGQPTPYQVCFYANNTTGALLGSSVYTAAIVATPSSVSPAAGPAAGGNTITVVGADFPTDPGRITATLGGAALTNIQSLSDKAFTALAPPHSVENNVALVVSTPAGTRALAGAYSYLNPIRVSPNTAPNTTPAVDVSVLGTGLMGTNFGTGGNAGRVFLVDGSYNGADAGAGVRANGPVAECLNVLVISDEELVCTLQLNRRLNAQGGDFFNPMTYTNLLTTDVSTTAGSRVIMSAAGKFNANDAGQPIVQAANANIPVNSIVTAVLSPTKAVISAPATATSGAAFTATIGNSTAVRTFPNALITTAGSVTVSLASGAFTRADVGRQFFATPGVPNGTTIVSMAPGGATATLSAPATLGTAGSLTNVSFSDTATTLTGSSLLATDVNAVIGANQLGIPAGTVLTAVTPGTSATLSAAATAVGAGVTLPVNRPVVASLYAAAPVVEGAYNLVVVSNGAPDAMANDPDYYQTDVTSSSTFTVASF